MATVTKATKGFKAQCPLCGEPDTMRVNLEDVSKLSCGSCDNDVTADDIREVMAGWQRLLKWLDTAPAVEE